VPPQVVWLFIWLAFGLLCCVGVTVAARHLPSRIVWAVWAILLLGILLLVVPRFVFDPFAASLGTGRGILVAISLFGAPSAAATWVATLRARRVERGRALWDGLIVTGVFMAGLLATIILLAVPDFIQFMSSES